MKTYHFVIILVFSIFILSINAQCGTWAYSATTKTYCITNCATKIKVCNVTCESTIGVFYGGSCLKSCPYAHFINTTTNTCTPCAVGCGSCQSSSQNCTTCLFNYTLADNGACYIPCTDQTCLPCPLNWYLDSIANICYPCQSALCKNCSLLPSYCQQCMNGTFNSTTSACTVPKYDFSYNPGVLSPQAALGVICGVILGLTVLILGFYFIRDKLKSKDSSKDKKKFNQS